MSRKHYILLAREIREQYEDSDTEVEKETIRLLVYKLCTVLKTDNRYFDREKFILASIG